MFDSFREPFLQARLSALALSAMDKGFLSIDAVVHLHLLSKTAGDIERLRDRVPASYQEMVFGLSALESEFERHAQRRSPQRKPSVKLERSIGGRSLLLAACAFEAEIETHCAGLDLVIDRRKGVLLVGDLGDVTTDWVRIAVRLEDPEATLNEVRAIREDWDE